MSKKTAKAILEIMFVIIFAFIIIGTVTFLIDHLDIYAGVLPYLGAIYILKAISIAIKNLDDIKRGDNK